MKNKMTLPRTTPATSGDLELISCADGEILERVKLEKVKDMSNYIELETCDAQIDPVNLRVMIMDFQGRRIFITREDLNKLVTALDEVALAQVVGKP